MGERGQFIDLIRPAEFDDDIFALDPSEIAQTCPQCLDPCVYRKLRFGNIGDEDRQE